MTFFSSRRGFALVTAMVGLIAGSSAVSADVPIDPAGPYRLGEAYADEPATCETIRQWIDKAPDTLDRVTTTIIGKLVAVEWDGTLAYLIMCQEPDVQVMCVTYSKENRNVGDTVLFAGGYNRAGERRIMLDPCLADPL
ncbi:MAG: hypothetical protein KUL88_14600 [Rhizobium sp.]|nr:hypothetical protein [Rhizobium sp.]